MLQAILIAVGVSIVLGFGSGWAVKSWKDSGEMSRLSNEAKVASILNDRCAADVTNVNQAFTLLKKSTDEQLKAAEAELERAKGAAAKHTALAKSIKDAPVDPSEPQCDAITREQREYVQGRRSGG